DGTGANIATGVLCIDRAGQIGIGATGSISGDVSAAGRLSELGGIDSDGGAGVGGLGGIANVAGGHGEAARAAERDDEALGAGSEGGVGRQQGSRITGGNADV